jgi:hypothetical protein
MADRRGIEWAAHVLLHAPPFFKSHLRASTSVDSVDQSACGGILGIFHSPLLGKIRLATLR